MTIIDLDFSVPEDAGVSDETPHDPNVLYCESCGTELTYSGRGRKPRFCVDCKDGAKDKKSKTGDVRRTSANVKLAAQAADVLAGYNDLAAMGLLALSMTESASAIAERNEVFRSQVREALVGDPALCRSILRVSKVSAKGALAFSYGLMAAAVFPAVMSETRELMTNFKRRRK